MHIYRLSKETGIIETIDEMVVKALAKAQLNTDAALWETPYSYWSKSRAELQKIIDRITSKIDKDCALEMEMDSQRLKFMQAGCSNQAEINELHDAERRAR